MKSPSRESTLLIAGVSSAAVLLLITISSSSYTRTYWQNSATKQIDASKASVSPTKGPASLGEQSTPMFEFHNLQLCHIVLKMATDRAKRWMSFQPSECCQMVGQVGGKSVQKRPLLTLEPNFVLKPVNMDHRGIREIAFYEAIEVATATNQRSARDTYCQLFGPHDLRPKSIKEMLLAWLNGHIITSIKDQSFIESTVETETKLLRRLELFTPEYFGVVDFALDTSSTDNITGIYGTNNHSHLLLHNLTGHFSKPCVLDLKVGTETYEPDAPNDKQLREQSKYPAQLELGFRMVAMRIYSPSNPKADDTGYIYFPKHYGRSLEGRNDVKQALLTFLGGRNLPTDVQANRAKAIQRILTQLKLIKSWFKDNSIFSFTASSILLIYEGNTETNEEGGIQPDLGTAKMIDFGRVRRNLGGDLGYLKGIRTLILILEEMLAESYWTEEYKYIE
jgi:Inositol polyphosphate kinase